MAFNVPGETPQEDDIDSGPFWPSINPAKLRLAQAIDGTVTSERLYEALFEAIATVNGELAEFKAAQIAAGIDKLEDVEAEKIADTSILVHRYRRAVGCLTKANLIERLRDYDTTGRGDRKVDALDPQIDELRRDARWAISDIRGVARTNVELI